jgi:hypothetical protein
MAVLPGIPGLEVRVKVEDEVVPDYPNTDAMNDDSEPGQQSRGHGRELLRASGCGRVLFFLLAGR